MLHLKIHSRICSYILITIKHLKLKSRNSLDRSFTYKLRNKIKKEILNIFNIFHSQIEEKES